MKQTFRVFYTSKTDAIVYGVSVSTDTAQTAVDAAAKRDSWGGGYAVMLITQEKGDPGMHDQIDRKAWLDKLIADGAVWPISDKTVLDKVTAKPMTAPTAASAPASKPARTNADMIAADGPAKPKPATAPPATPPSTVKPAMPGLTRSSSFDKLGLHGSAHLL